MSKCVFAFLLHSELTVQRRGTNADLEAGFYSQITGVSSPRLQGASRNQRQSIIKSVRLRRFGKITQVIMFVV